MINLNDPLAVLVKRVTDIMSEITAASQEQSAGIEQVNQAITQMDAVTQQNAALVEEAAAAAIFNIGGSHTAVAHSQSPARTTERPAPVTPQRKGLSHPGNMARLTERSILCST